MSKKVLTKFPTFAIVEDTIGVSRGLLKFSLTTCSRPLCIFFVQYPYDSCGAFVRSFEVNIFVRAKGSPLLC